MPSVMRSDAKPSTAGRGKREGEKAGASVDTQIKTVPLLRNDLTQARGRFGTEIGEGTHWQRGR